MPSLSRVLLTLDTHNDNKDFDTLLHVFVKNRVNTTHGSEGETDFISNLLAYQRYLEGGDRHDRTNNPFIATGIGLISLGELKDGESRTFTLDLPPDPVSLDDIVLPVFNVHILPNGNDRWIFDFTLRFEFDDGSFFFFSSKDSGIPGIILDQDNRNHSSICAENPLRPFPSRRTPVTNAVLRKIVLDFDTHDDNKDSDTRLDVRIVNRVNSSVLAEIAVGENLLPGVEFVDRGTPDTVTWPSEDGSLTLFEIALADMVLPEIEISIDPNGNDRWIFDYRLRLEFEDPRDFGGKRTIFTSSVSGIILDQDNSVHRSVWRGGGFPEVAARTAPPLTLAPIDRANPPKVIPLSLLRRKFDEFINDRNGADTDHNPPLQRIRLHNTGAFGLNALPESYADLRTITAGRDKVNYVSSPINFGQLTGTVFGIFDSFLNDINSGQLSLVVEDQPTGAPFTVKVDFETGGSHEVTGFLSTMDFLEFSVALRLTLKLDEKTGLIDVLGWIPEIQDMKVRLDHEVGNQRFFRYTGTFLGEPVDLVAPETETKESLFTDQVLKVHLVTSSALDPGGIFRQHFRDTIFDKLASVDRLTHRSRRDGLNATVTSFLLGGVADDEDNTDGNNNVISSVGIVDDNIVIAYTGPQRVFVPETPPNWPAAYDFSPGTLENIDHIVVLMMENRSFDHMLGYLSLPVAQGGAGRSDVDGLRGGEANPFRGTQQPAFALTDTFFSPDPPHGFEPVHRAINGGSMDGFAEQFAEQNGSSIAGKVMGHHTAAGVPVYDALARDFAIGHRWFSSHPGPTFCNRFYELTGRLNTDPRGFWEFDNPSPVHPIFTKTIFDYLNGAIDPLTGEPVTWAYFEQGYCFLRLFERYTFDDTNIASFEDQERGFFTRARTGQLPNVCFIEPRFVELPPDVNCDGPPSDVTPGQRLIERVVEALVAGPAWEKTLLLVIYDEHGGFYDHVPPSAAARVSPELPIDTHGVRVPALLVSPWVDAGTVFGDDDAAQPHNPVQRNDLHFDHTSVPRTIVRRFLSDNPPYLGARFAAANDLSSVVTRKLRRLQFRPFIGYQFKFIGSQMLLAVQGTSLVQRPADSSPAQDFSFEDAGDGFFYIRAKDSRLYLTAAPKAQGNETSAVTLEQKRTGQKQAIQFQQWNLRPLGSKPEERDLFVIEARGVPGRILQPDDPNLAGSPVVLGTLGRINRTGKSRGAWLVDSNLL